MGKLAKNAMKKERVELGARSYDIMIGSGILGSQAAGLIAGFKSPLLMVTNRKIMELYGGGLLDSLGKLGVKAGHVIIPDGEKYKSLATVEKIYDSLVRGKYDRKTMIVALGGGVVGDIAGFAAATYMRGVRVIQIPTTLLSQVDSSVGGKTGVNHPKGKNLIGAFHQPSMVIADVDALKTLPKEEILGGVAEVIKYGCIADAKFFGYLEKNMDALLQLDPDVAIHVVRRCCRIKADVVAGDEREAGLRAILNFGHTVGHAIEAITSYKKFSHGYAVAMGMRAAAIISELMGTLSTKEADRITGLLVKAGLPVVIPMELTGKGLIKAMEHDKKAVSGEIRFALLDGLGKSFPKGGVSRAQIAEALKRCGELPNVR